MVQAGIVNAVGNGATLGIAGEIVIVDVLGLFFPAGSRVLEFAYPLLFLRIDANNGMSACRKSLALTMDIGELLIAHPSRGRVTVARFQPLVIHPQAESELFQQTTDGSRTDSDL